MFNLVKRTGMPFGVFLSPDQISTDRNGLGWTFLLYMYNKLLGDDSVAGPCVTLQQTWRLEKILSIYYFHVNEMVNANSKHFQVGRKTALVNTNE
jgi:hypothetical protein